MADESFYTDADLVGAGEFVEGQTTLATRMTLPAGTIKSVRLRFPSAAPTGTVAARVYADAGGAALASANFSASPVLDAWNLATVNLAVAAGTYRVTIVTPNRYVALGGFFASGSITRGNITATNSRFDGGDVFPTQTSTATYFADVVFEAGGAVAGVLAVTLPALTVAMSGLVLPDGQGRPYISTSRVGAQSSATSSAPIISTTGGRTL